MDPADSPPLARFSNPNEALSHLDAEHAGALIASAADVALVLDRDGAFSIRHSRKWTCRVRSGATGSAVVGSPRSAPTVAKRSKRCLALPRQQPWRVGGRSITQPTTTRTSRCATAIRFGGERRILAVGRDLRAMADLQLRLAEAQQAMEREYVRIRNAEKRYRLLFQLSSEAVLIVDSDTAKSSKLIRRRRPCLGSIPRKLMARLSATGRESSRQASQSFIAAARVAPRVDNVHVELERDRERAALGVPLSSGWRSPSAGPVSRLGETGGATPPKTPIFWAYSAPCQKLLSSPMRTDKSSAPTRPLSISFRPRPVQVRGELVERWIGRHGVDMDVLYSNLRAHGVVRHFSTVARGEFGTVEDVEVSAVSAMGSRDLPRVHHSLRALRRTGASGRTRVAPHRRAIHGPCRPGSFEKPRSRDDGPDRTALHRGGA